MGPVLIFLAALLLGNCKCGDCNHPFPNSRAIRSVPVPPWNLTYLDKLRNDLLTNYDKYARPGHHLNIATVGIGITIVHIETDELNSTVSVSSWLKLYWADPKLKWDKDDYGGIDNIKMADHEVWQPDIYLYNSASSGGEAVTRYGNPNALVYSNGQVLWIPPIKFNALCEFNLRYWPFDTQHCYLKFASWSRSAKEIKLELFGDIPVDFEPIIDISPWAVNVTTEVVSDFRICCPDTYYHAHFNLTLTRRSWSYMPVVITPAIVIACLILMESWLPSQERIILSGFTAVMISMLLLYFSQKISAIGLSVPWIGIILRLVITNSMCFGSLSFLISDLFPVIFYTTSLYIACLSLMKSIFILLLLKPKQKQTLPWIVKKHLRGRFGTFLLLDYNSLECNCGVGSQTAEEMKDYHRSEFEDKVEEHAAVLKTTPESRVQQEWEILALAIDRIFFLVYCFVYLVLFFGYMI